ncbi:3-carboxy-cis,cis-muconate cycloisomerase [Georgenia halophila]|uniref:3-carboxy-cis,cis-muconate cycloisomerase n=1 Tax=Georgenia halophila TaxID=620889 RepID=A0ABP8LBD1_9MICO
MTLLGAVAGVAEVDELLDDPALVQSMVTAEIALLRACERADLVPAGTADAAAAAVTGHRFDPAALGAAATSAGNPVVPLVKELLTLVPDDARAWLHHGATSQDILDTALMLRAAVVVDVELSFLAAARDAAAALADRHRATRQVGRTLGQHAVPTTFGVTAAGWAVGLDAARRELEAVRSSLAVQLGGAAGTLGVYGPAGPAVVTAFAEELGLAAPALPWHTDRSRIRSLASALGGAVMAAGKVATDVVALSASEVGEVAEGGGAGHGGSSAMPHKRNPVTSVLVRGAAVRAPGLVSTLHAAGLQEHQRATGSWHAEWQPLLELLSLAGGAATRISDVLAGLEVDADRMAETLAAARPAVMAEHLTAALKPRLGRDEAQRVVGAAMTAGDDAAVVAAVLDSVAADAAGTGAGLGAAELHQALDPGATLTACGAIVDSALQSVTHPDVAR